MGGIPGEAGWARRWRGTLTLPASVAGRSAGVWFEACLGNGSVASSCLGCDTSGCWTQLDPDGICDLAQLRWARTLRELRGSKLLRRKGSCFVWKNSFRVVVCAFWL